MLRQRIVFYGWVQGVGFRYWARHAASMYGATGWVRNDPDGTVTMEIQSMSFPLGFGLTAAMKLKDAYSLEGKL